MTKYFTLILFVFLILNCSGDPELSLDNIIEGKEQILNSASGLILDEEADNELTNSDSVTVMNSNYILNDNKFADTQDYITPFDCYKISLRKGDYYIRFVSVGNMAGLKKSFMLPMIEISDSKGNNIPYDFSTQPVIIEPTFKYSASIIMVLYFNVPADGEIYITVYSNMAYENCSIMSFWPDDGIVTFPSEGNAFKDSMKGSSKTYIFKKAPFADYKMLLVDDYNKINLEEFDDF